MLSRVEHDFSITLGPGFVNRYTVMLFLPFLKSETAVVSSCDEFLLQKGSTLSYGEVFFSL